MAGTALDELFMAETMTDTVRRFADQSEERSFLDPYESGTRIEPIADDFTFDEVQYSRGLAPVTGPQSPTKSFPPLGVTKKAGQVFKVAEHVRLPVALIHQARGMGSLMPNPAGWLDENLLNLTNRVQRTRNYWAAQSLHSASVDLGAFPNSDIAQVLTYPVQTLSALNPWSAAATKIRSAEFNPIVETYRKKTGFDPGEAIASPTVEGYMVGNTELRGLIDAGGVPLLGRRQVEEAYRGMGVRMGGINWRFAKDYYTADATPDTTTDVISDADLVPILPPRARWAEAFAMVEGRQWVPSGAITSMAVGDPTSLTTEVRGWFAYLELQLNPVTIVLHVGWAGNFVHLLKDAVMVFNTTP